MDLSLLITLALAALAGIVWLVRLEGRHNVLASLQAATDKRIDGMESRIFAQLDRIESKLDGKADK